MKKRRHYNTEINPDEIFLDSSNLPDFDMHQFEGRIETPIRKRAVILIGFFFFVVGGLFAGKLWNVQVRDGASFRVIADNNHLREVPLFSERGVILDRNGVPLAWNSTFPEEEEKPFFRREYIKKPGFAHVLGYVAYPSRDKAGNYYRVDFEGKDGVEQRYDATLQGVSGMKIMETDALGGVRSENVVRAGVDGGTLTLTIDSRIQEIMHREIASLAARVGFTGGAGVMMDVRTGEVIALTNYPEYDPNILSNGKEGDAIHAYVRSRGLPFLNRAVSGLYTPGSIVKPFVALAALNEGVITPEKHILSTGSISVQNPYDPSKKTVFRDWKAHGLVAVRDALAVSSDVYFYEVGGGFGDQKGIGIEKIKAYMNLFGVGTQTGIDLDGEKLGLIPTPEWKQSVFNDPWRVGDTYITAIGQYGFQVTPIQMARAIAAVASDGLLTEPHIVRSVARDTSAGTRIALLYDVHKIGYIEQEYFTIVKEGMRQAVTAGTAQGLSVPFVKVAGKTGTAEIGAKKQFVNSWIVGFFPYESPRYVFTVVMEHGPHTNLVGGTYVMRQVLDWMGKNTPEYFE